MIDVSDVKRFIAELETKLNELKSEIEQSDENVKPRINVGDYVVALPEADEEYIMTNTEMKLGKITEIYEDDGEDIEVEIIEHTEKDYVGNSYRVNPKYFRKATREEIEEVKLAKIGRKPGEFKKGDIIEVTGYITGNKYYGVIDEICDEKYFKFRRFGFNRLTTEEFIHTRLICPVEHRFDMEASY